MQIHIARKGTQLGVFTSEEVRDGLASGRFAGTDLAWREGMAEWKALGEWPEFAGAVPGSPSSADAPSVTSAPAAVASEIPWERSKSAGSFFATVRQAIFNPSVLSTGRLGFGDWLLFCYVALAFAAPFNLAGVFMAGQQNAALADMIRGFGLPQFNEFADQMARTPPTPVGWMIFQMAMGLAFTPIFYAGVGLAYWVGQRIFQIRVPAERTAAATLLASGALLLLAAPFQLLAFDLRAQLIVGVLTFIPFCVVYFRAVGAATGVNPWAQFGISCFVWFVLCACCCLLPAGVFGLLVSR
ncbi:MAG: DUF4339 domain-containing protein [Verrucomicrobiota bacterium]